LPWGDIDRQVEVHVICYRAAISACEKVG